MSELTEFVDKNPFTTFFILMVIDGAIANICKTIMIISRRKKRD